MEVNTNSFTDMNEMVDGKAAITLVSNILHTLLGLFNNNNSNKKKKVEMPGIEPGAFHMRSERSTTELHPLFANQARRLTGQNERNVVKYL